MALGQFFFFQFILLVSLWSTGLDVLHSVIIPIYEELIVRSHSLLDLILLSAWFFQRFKLLHIIMLYFLLWIRTYTTLMNAGFFFCFHWTCLLIPHLRVLGFMELDSFSKDWNQILCSRIPQYACWVADILCLIWFSNTYIGFKKSTSGDNSSYSSM